MKPYRRVLSLALALLIPALSLAGCGGGADTGTDTKEESETPVKGSETVKNPETSADPGVIDGIAYITYPLVERFTDAIVDFGNSSFAAKNSGIASRLTTAKKFEDAERGIKEKKALRANNAAGAFTLGSLLLKDLSEYESIEFSVYSGKATGARLQLRISNENTAGSKMAPYYRLPFTVDWTGWKTFRFSTDLLSGNYNPHLDGIVSLSLDTSGWDLTYPAGTVLYFGNVYANREVRKVTSDEPFEPEEVCAEVKERWREMLVGQPGDKSNVSEAYRSILDRFSNAGKSALEKYKSTGDKKFGYEVTFEKGGCEANVTSIYGQIESMATAYAAPGSALYHDEELLAAISEALAYGYDNFYGPCVWEKGTWGNWWDWDIGIPLHLTTALILLEKELGPELCKKYLAPFDFLNYYPSMTACNKLWITDCVLISALLQNDVERVLRSAMIMNDVFDYVPSGDGFYEDGSFIQHDTLAYTGGYGLSMLYEVTRILSVFHGTRLEFRDENVANHYRWALESFRPVIYGGRLFASVRGREVFRNTTETAANTSAVVSMVRMTTYAPPEIRSQLEATIRGYMLSTGKDYASDMPPLLCEYAAELAKNDKIAPCAEFLVTKVFGMMDRVVFHGTDYGACIALSSTRIQKYEAINGENGEGWFQGDGMLYVYTDGYDYGYNFFHYADPYKMPGTTLNTETRKNENVGSMFGSSPFAGGAENGEYGVAAMILGIGNNSYYKSDITARKSYFTFDNEIVCIGSGIRDGGGTEVRTILENRLWRADDVLTLNGEKAELTEGAPEAKKLKTAHFTNMGGYYFPEETEVTLARVRNTGGFFEMWTSHGQNPTDGGYAYVLLPSSDAKQTEAYAASPDIRILGKTAAVHAVREEKLGITGYVFFEKGEFEGVKVSDPCAVTVHDGKDGKTVTFSDPTHLLDKLSVTLNLGGVSKIVSSDEKVRASVENGVVTLTLDASGNVGQTFTVVVK